MATAGTRGTAKKKAAFLQNFSASGNVTLAAQAAGVDRRTPYKWLESDANFAERWREAEQQAADALETEARRRAVEGVDEPVFYKGDVVGSVRKYSDTLLIFLLNGARPEKYRQRHELTGKDGGPIAMENRAIQPANVVDERLRELGLLPPGGGGQ